MSPVVFSTSSILISRRQRDQSGGSALKLIAWSLGIVPTQPTVDAAGAIGALQSATKPRPGHRRSHHPR
jgi:hypothetical protein